ncbi:reverse transcriptase [Cucumis melo var. makuwa]|uniref:Reverse transcriptase n=1 Tax=Cucumis melo var. makuwa TaxID=1194695 RepID=A0A5D3CXA3_CUCMM|nr:reverse transcriptase [Cucumis melo var. makuwa]
MLYIVVPSKEELQSSAPVSLYSHATSIIKFNGLNFSDWCEQIQFHLGVLDLDLALLSEKPTAITSASSDEDRYFYKAWERSNRLSLMFMRMTVANNIKSTIKNTEDAKEFMKSVEKCSQSESADKSLVGTLMSTLTNIKFDGSRIIHEHILEMTNLAARLKTMGMEVNENFLVTFILNSLLSEYGPFHMNYNTLKDKWNVHELQSMLIQKEARLKKPIIHSANLVGHKGAGKKPKKKNGKGNHGQLKNGQCPGPFAKFLESHDICAQYTMPGTPQQNGVAERVPSKSVPKTPFELWTRRKPSLRHLHVWGCQAEARIYNPHEKKLDSRTTSDFFIVVDSVNNPQEQQIDGQTPYHDIVTNEPSEFDLSIDNDPVSFSQAIKGDNSTKWLDAMKEELKSMNDNKVWDLVKLLKESKRVGCKWVFKIKRDSNGNIERHKARLVAKGYTQKDGIDYKETFSPVSKKDSLIIIMALVAHYDLELHQMDVKTVFLNENLDEEVFMDQPEGFMVEGKEHMVCKLKRSIYGLKQASRQWYQSNPGMDHWKAAKKVLRYMQGTKDYMLTYKRSDHLEVPLLPSYYVYGSQGLTLKIVLNVQVQQY